MPITHIIQPTPAHPGDGAKPVSSPPAPSPVDGAAARTTGANGDPLPTGEIGGPSGPEPTRYGDWEHKGRCSDF